MTLAPSRRRGDHSGGRPCRSAFGPWFFPGCQWMLLQAALTPLESPHKFSRDIHALSFGQVARRGGGFLPKIAATSCRRNSSPFRLQALYVCLHVEIQRQKYSGRFSNLDRHLTRRSVN